MPKPQTRNGAPHCDELEWYFREAPSTLGDRSIFPGLVASIERGATSGNTGTKGVGRESHLPMVFESEGDHLVTRDSHCYQSLRLLSERHRLILRTVYLLRGDRVPAGLAARIGDDLAGVAILLALELGEYPELLKAIPKWETAGGKWHRMALEASRCAHDAWYDARARVDRERFRTPVEAPK